MFRAYVVPEGAQQLGLDSLTELFQSLLQQGFRLYEANRAVFLEDFTMVSTDERRKQTAHIKTLPASEAFSAAHEVTVEIRQERETFNQSVFRKTQSEALRATHPTLFIKLRAHAGR